MADEDKKAADTQAPELPEAAEKADAPEKAEAPKQPDAAGQTKAPKQPESPEKAEAPAQPEAAGQAKAPKQPEAAEKAEAPAQPEASEKAEAPKQPEAAGQAKAPKQPESPEKAEAPKQPEAAEKAEASAPPDAAGQTETPKQPEAPDATAKPGEAAGDEAKPDGGAGNGETRTLTDLADLGGVTAGAPSIEAEPETPEPKLDAQGRAYATGKRKDAIARVWIKPGGGRITINGRDWVTYFARPVLRMIIDQPLVATARKDQYDIWCTVKGGGLSGQAGAVRHGLSKALTSFEPDLRRLLKTGGFLTRDARVVERKKYGRHKARRSHQFSKR